MFDQLHDIYTTLSILGYIGAFIYGWVVCEACIYLVRGKL